LIPTSTVIAAGLMGVLGIAGLIIGIQQASVVVMLIGCVLIVVSLVAVLGRINLVRQLGRLELDTGYLTKQYPTYSPIGRTLADRFDAPRGFHAVERHVVLGHGRELFERAAQRILRWEVKSRAGFRVIRVGEQGSFFSDDPVAPPENAVIRFGPLRETVRVVGIVDEPRRRGFAYGTLPRHPLRGEEAFLVDWNDDDSVRFTVRSMSAPQHRVGWLVFPLVLVAQGFFLRRYLRALLD
jgi:uncharacterized protein (UPF0548 family)